MYYCGRYKDPNNTYEENRSLIPYVETQIIHLAFVELKGPPQTPPLNI